MRFVTIEIPVGGLEFRFQFYFQRGEIEEFPPGKVPGSIHTVVGKAEKKVVEGPKGIKPVPGNQLPQKRIQLVPIPIQDRPGAPKPLPKPAPKP